MSLRWMPVPTTAVTLKPDWAEVHASLGIAHAAQGDAGAAKAAFLRAVKLDPALAEGWSNLGVLHLADKEFDAAIADDLMSPRALPLLEELQIEGAEVLPEIMQTLEQIDVTIAGIGSASVSLEPAPSKIPAISATMDSSSAGITDTLGSL